MPTSPEQSSQQDDRWYAPTPLAQRPSQHVDASNFVGWFGKLALTGISVGAAAWVVAKVTKPKILIPQSIRNAGKPFGFWQDTYIAPSSYFGLGTKIGVLVKAFMMWRKGEAEHLGVADIHKDIHVIAEAVPDAEALVTDSALVTKMIGYEKRQQAALMPQATVHAQAHLHHGAVVTAETPHQVIG